jgi:hypothetical protein
MLSTWYIENPISKELVKNITLRMSPLCEKEFIIVMKAPSDRISFNLASFLYIRLANSRKNTKNIEKTLKSSGNELEDIKITTLK